MAQEGAIDLCDDEPDRVSDDAVWVIDDDEVGFAAPASSRDKITISSPHQQGTRSTAAQQVPGLYVLDCGCQGDHQTLTTRLQQDAGRLQQALGCATAVGGASVAEAMGRLACTTCGSLLSAQDTWKLLGADCTTQVYTALCRSIKQLVLAQQQHAPASPTFDDDSGPGAAAISACVELWQELSELQALMSGADPAAVTKAASSTPGKSRRRATQQQQPKAKGSKSKSSSGAWAAGTGYGGGIEGLTKHAQAAMSAAAARQAAADAAMVGHLQAITALLQEPWESSSTGTAGGPSSSSGAGRKRPRGGAGGSGAVMMGLPWPLCGVVLAGPLTWLLRLLFHNDSLMDVVKRTELYSAGMDLLKHIGASADLLPLLQLPADDPRDSSTPAGGSAAGPSSSSSTLLSVLRRLEQQAKLYRRSAEQLMAEEGEGDEDEDEETTAAVCLALDISTLVAGLEESLELFSSTLQDLGSLTLKAISAAADPPPQQAQQGTTAPGQQQSKGTGSGRNERKGRGAAATPAAPAAAAPPAQSPEAAAAATRERAYITAMQPYQFMEADLVSSGHYFARDAAAGAKASAGGEVMRRRLKRITEELGALSTSLPLSWDSSILLAVQEDRLDVLRALLLPHPETPYGGGAFVFDILLPPEYPDKPPKVQFLTTGSGRWRANPNLYACGKVCLSLLGTWSGPSWQPGVSTLLQVLVSLQSMVFVPDPYFNEPGYERSGSTAAGRQASATYNADVRFGTASYALLPALQRPDVVFKDALRVHYTHQGPRVRQLLQQWLTECRPEKKQQLRQVVTAVGKELDRLPAPPAIPQQQQQQQQLQQQQQQLQQQQQQQQQPPPRPRRQQQQQVQTSSGAADVDVVDLT